MHSTLNNGALLPFFLFFLGPMLVHEIFVVEEIYVLMYGIDGVVIGFALFVLIIWANKDNVLFIIRELRTILSSKKNRLKIF